MWSQWESRLVEARLFEVRSFGTGLFEAFETRPFETWCRPGPVECTEQFNIHDSGCIAGLQKTTMHSATSERSTGGVTGSASMG